MRALRLALLPLVSLVSCGDARPVPNDPAGPPSSASVAATSEAPLDARIYPTQVEDLAKLAPDDATLVVGLPPLEAARTLVDATTLEQLVNTLTATIAEALGFPRSAVAKAMETYDGAMVFVRGPMESPKGAAAIRVKDGELVERALRAAQFEDKGGGRWRLAEAEPLHAMWLEQAKVVIVANDAAALEAALDAVSGKRPSFADSLVHKPRNASDLWATLDLATLFADSKLAATTLRGSMARASLVLGKTPGAGRFEIEYTHLGELVPRLGLVLAPSAQTALEELPSGALIAGGLSVKRMPGKSLKDVADELGRMEDDDVADDLDRALQKLAKVSLANVDAALGDEISAGIYYGGGRLDLGDRNAAKAGALLFDIRTKDDKIAAKIVDAAGKTFEKQDGFKAKPGRFSFPLKRYALEVVSSRGHVHVALGGADAIAKALKAATLKTDRLGASPKFVKAKQDPSSPTHLAVYLDVGALGAALPFEANAEMLQRLGDTSTLLALTLGRNENGFEAAAASGGGPAAIAAIGTVSALVIYGVRRYIASSRSSEAKNTLGAIGRGAISAFERGRLCPSANAVPSFVPRGTSYTPVSTAGKDYETVGWKCLRFTISSSQHYQYDYRAGGNYKGLDRGAADPGPNGFQISAEGDLDGDGVTSLFLLTGLVDPTAKTVRLATQIQILDEFE